MQRKGLGAVVGAALAAGLAVGCAGTPGEPVQPGPAPEAIRPATPPPVSLDPREERRLNRELLRDVGEYYRLLREKNVEQAAAYAPADRRAALQEQLWEFVARYRVESADVVSHELFPQLDGVLARLQVRLTLFEKRSVVPTRSEVSATWRYQGDRWVLVPEQRK